MTSTTGKRIHPIIMYPFQFPKDTTHLIALYKWLDELTRQNANAYRKPITVVNRQTYHRYKRDQKFKSTYQYVGEHSYIIDSWCVDTCQMWLSGFGFAYDRTKDIGEDVYWLIPGDFNYSDASQEVLTELQRIPMEIYNKNAELCIGELHSEPYSSKQLIDTYATYGLMYNWFPEETSGLGEINIMKPRSEFFALDRNFLEIALIKNRWFAYEQTIVLLLLARPGQPGGRAILKVDLGDLRDPTRSRDTPVTALHQIERTERVLKHFWREERDKRDKGADPTWIDEFDNLNRKSSQIVNSAMVVLRHMLERSK